VMDEIERLVHELIGKIGQIVAYVQHVRQRGAMQRRIVEHLQQLLEKRSSVRAIRSKQRVQVMIHTQHFAYFAETPNDLLLFGRFDDFLQQIGHVNAGY